MQALKKLFKIDKEQRPGLYLTISFHLIILIILLVRSISSILQTETSFVLDFTKQEEIEREIQEQEFRASVSKELDAMIAEAATVTPRNVAVDVASRKGGSNLKDDRSTNPNEVYNEAKRLQDKLDASKRAAEAARESDDMVSVNDNKENKKEETYVGPSVISYRLDGRKAMSLPIPAYKCLGGGDVSVAIIVNRKGYVVAAKVLENVSSKDICLIEYAIKAAKMSRFTASTTADERQAGEIVYRFIAQ